MAYNGAFLILLVALLVLGIGRPDRILYRYHYWAALLSLAGAFLLAGWVPALVDLPAKSSNPFDSFQSVANAQQTFAMTTLVCHVLLMVSLFFTISTLGLFRPPHWSDRFEVVDDDVRKA